MKRYLAALILFPALALAHEMPIGKADLHARANGELTLDWELDLVSYAMGNTLDVTAAELRKQYNELSAEQKQEKLNAAARQLNNLLKVHSGQKKIVFQEAVGPSAEELSRLIEEGKPGHGAIAFRGAAAEGAVRFRFPREAGPVVLTVFTGKNPLFQQLLLSGEESPEIALGVAAAADPFMTAWRYLILGFEHILPLGLDHILFVLGLFLLNPALRPLLQQITTFTIAHSITLGLSMTGVFSLPGEIVEPIIALSIVFVAAENILVKNLHPWRLMVVFLFGLVHGLGFAGVLQELGVPREQFATALISFNVGVEFGQLAVIALALLVTGWSLKRQWYRPRLAIPASVLIACVGAYWTAERLMG